MRGPLVLLVVATALASAGCDSILGVDDHQLAPTVPTGPGLDGGFQGDVAVPEDAPSSHHDSAPAPDGSPLSDGSADSGEAGNPGMAVAAFSCANDGGACVFGGIFSVGRVPGDAGVGALPDGGVAAVTDDGFEFGNTVCDSTGMTCVTGALTP